MLGALKLQERMERYPGSKDSFLIFRLWKNSVLFGLFLF